MSLGCWRHLGDECQQFGFIGRLVLGQHSRQDSRVVVDDCVADQLGALVVDIELKVGAVGQFLLFADPSNGRAWLVVGFDAVLRAVGVAQAG